MTLTEQIDKERDDLNQEIERLGLRLSAAAVLARSARLDALINELYRTNLSGKADTR
ncbi:MAG: aspartyl-phosphate phosphatase Spo0E family protein [Clostridiales bacterium]|jgi:hypothetical protein|nr:aspartyl-phosphate phosphatase Spo0E family protein [Clostridiales bacterium]